MTARKRLEQILITFDCFENNVNYIINQAKYLVREELKIKNLDEVLDSLSEKFDNLIELQLKEAFNENGSIKNLAKLDKIADSLSKKIHGMIKIHFDSIILQEKEVSEDVG